ncbi:MAG TPA: protein tyrosine phosphatase [Cyclobacteriaceae bacterium]
MNILFICSRNKWRSLTAETIFKNNQDYVVRSAGTENEARIRVSERLIIWADLIFVMEKRHRERLKEKFEFAMREKDVIVLDIPDDYQYMDPELIETLKTAMAPYL